MLLDFFKYIIKVHDFTVFLYELFDSYSEVFSKQVQMFSLGLGR